MTATERRRPRTDVSASALSILAVVLGALPAAALGLDVAWVVVASGSSILVLAPLLARRQVGSLVAVERPPNVVVSEGRTASIRASIRSHRTVRDVLVSLALDGATETDHGRAPRLALGALEGGHDLGLACPIRLPRRGRHTGLVLRATSSFPFGLVRSSREWFLPGPVTVHPRTFDRSDRRLDRVLERIAVGVDEARRTRVQHTGRGLPIGFRGARPGDTARDIAWRPSARRGRWLAQERAPTKLVQVRVQLVAAVHGRGPYGTQPFTAEARGEYGASRREMAFEWAVRATASLTTRLCARGHDVVSTEVVPLAGAPLEDTLRTEPDVLAASPRVRDHLEALTDVRPGVHETASEDATHRPRARRGEPAGPSITVVPIVRTGGELAPTVGNLRGDHVVLGIDAVGRLSELSESRRSRTVRPPRARTAG